MSNPALLKILRGVCATLILVISFPIAGQAHMHGIHFDGGRLGRPHFGTARARYDGPYRTELERHRVSSQHGIGSTWYGSYPRGVTAPRFASYDDWRQSYWPYWGWDMAASVLATDPVYYSYYYGVGSSYEEPADAGAVAYCVQRFRSYDLTSGTYLGRDGYRHPCP